MEKSPGDVTYTPEFTKDARFRAVELILTALIRELPDRMAFMERLNQLIDNEHSLYLDKARELPEGPRVSALEVVNAQMEAVRDEANRVFLGKTPPGPT
ncbi:hypothetical protein [Luteibacter sp. SG786]|uniref:hypothetical protein n=1 Tax=Luteibacter sp. SG786 TaxID=2587130 RepID=UPI00141DB704|nr:hypothetical protein [Luteibacter sp. SG786]NII53559.1 hypothetical protein [Luteibacter sp. SG786]